MLQLKDIRKDYPVAGGTVPALKGISLSFRKNEFVSVLGASGCGKTTLLNIIGGLDKYSSGDLIINGVSTKKYSDRDWDTYRNHSVGFIFQSYHLIPHQTILQNVELALIISGVSKEERRQRAIDALNKVGLGDKIKSRPNQLSGGQAQRVAIARALINDPEIVLADEPTGALDSKTSVQIMDLLKEISRDRLVIMVTHNPELAEKYSTRIIKLLDGEVTDDSMPYTVEEQLAEVQIANEQSAQSERKGNPSQPQNAQKTNKGKKKLSSMPLNMSFMLSLKNLLSKIKRTAMVAVAGSIGIIGVSMVLAISSGVQGYITGMQDDMLSGYPLTVRQTTIDMDALMDFSSETKADVTKLKDKVYVDSLLESLMGMSKTLTTNNITDAYISYVDNMPDDYYNALQYVYEFNLANNIYTDFKVTDSDIAEADDVKGNYSITAIRQMYTSVLQREPEYAAYSSMISSFGSFDELPDNHEYILSQYDILASSEGRVEDLSENQIKDIFNDKQSLILVLSDNSISDISLGQFGYTTQEEFINFAYKALKENSLDGGDNYDEALTDNYFKGKDFEFFTGKNSKSFTWYPNDTIYSEVDPDSDEKFYNVDAIQMFKLSNELVEIQKKLENPEISAEERGKLFGELTEKSRALQECYSEINGVKFKYNHNSENFDKNDGVELKVKAILQKKKDINYGCLSSGFYYTNSLTRHMLETSAKSRIVKYMNENGGSLSCVPYNYEFTYRDDDGYHKNGGFLGRTNTAFIQAAQSGGMMSMMMSVGSSSNRVTPEAVGGSSTPEIRGGISLPVGVNIYPVSFDSKDNITNYLDKWNDMCKAGEEYRYTSGGTETTVSLKEADIVKYTDTVGLIIMMINTMIQMITIALIAFTALSLVVSTVMVGIITYVSVVERTKEIGILRAVGARKKDIKRLFIAETFIIGLAAGVVGIAVTYILSLIINIIVGSLTGIFTIAALPVLQALIMIVVSVILTLISGVMPASAAAKKDPVVALRTE